MPKQLERKLEAEATRKGYTGKKKDRYVYGSLYNIEHHNRAGWLGPDKLVRNKTVKIPKFDYDPTFKNVHGVHIGVVVAFLVVAYFLVAHKLPMGNAFAGGATPNGNGASQYISTRSVEGWEAVQYHSQGAYAGALVGESD